MESYTEDRAVCLMVAKKAKQIEEGAEVPISPFREMPLGTDFSCMASLLKDPTSLRDAEGW